MTDQTLKNLTAEQMRVISSALSLAAVEWANPKNSVLGDHFATACLNDALTATELASKFSAASIRALQEPGR